MKGLGRDITKILINAASHKICIMFTLGLQTATTATVGAVGALLGDLCTEDADCAVLPGAHCARGGCVCRPGYAPTAHRKACGKNT